MPFVSGRPGRSPVSYPTRKGTTTYSPKTRSYSGPGTKPKGAKIRRVPTTVVTTGPTGKVTTSGFSSPRAAVRAKQRSQAARRRVSRVERQQASALAFHRRSQQRASGRLSQPSAAALAKRVASATAGTMVSSRKPQAPKLPTAQGAKTAGSVKPPKFQGVKTAGTPTYKELQVADKQGAIRLNKRGYVTTPAVRKVSSSLKRLEAKARQSQGPLPGLTPQQSKVARTVLRRGVKAGATRKEELAAAETGLVESDFENLSYGDSDSEGWRQERTSIYGTGPTGPRNVKASADRFYRELRTDPGAATAPTAGMAAQAAQGSARPERYDEVKPQANAIVKAFEREGLKPAQQRKLTRAQAKARKLGLKVPGASKVASGRLPSVVYIGKIAEKKFGLHVGENPAFGGVAPVHVADSYHYRTDAKGRGEAIDASGTPEKMMAFDRWVAKKYGSGVTELFYDPGISIKEGTEIGSIGGHEDHVHVAIAQPGETFGGTGYTAPSGSAAVFVGYGSSASAAKASATNAAKAAAKGKGRRKSPLQGIFRKLKRLDELGAGLSEKSSEGSESKASILAGLERKYGKAAV